MIKTCLLTNIKKERKKESGQSSSASSETPFILPFSACVYCMALDGCFSIRHFIFIPVSRKEKRGEVGHAFHIEDTS